MAERDEFDELVKRLLPCEWLTDHGVTENCEYADKEDVCHTCACHPAVASALREAAKREADLGKQVIDLEQRLAAMLKESGELSCFVDNLRREVERLQNNLNDLRKLDYERRRV